MSQHRLRSVTKKFRRGEGRESKGGEGRSMGSTGLGDVNWFLVVWEDVRVLVKIGARGQIWDQI